MSRSSSFIAAVAVLALALAPSASMAKAGGGFSFGSRGGRTYSAPPSTSTAPSQAMPFDRSLTPRSAPSAPLGGGAAPFAQPRRSGFMSGLAGGLLGVGLGSLLFGGGLFGGNGFGFFSLIGLLLQGALLFFVARWLFRTFMPQLQARTAMAGGNAYPRPAPVPVQAGTAPAGGGLVINKADYTAFEQLLQAVQTAWSNADTRALGGVATPEMVGYFSEQLAEQASRGVRNSVTHVKLEKGDLSEAWVEGNRDYATVAMQFSALDVTRDASGRVVDGDVTLRTMTTELWTFMRAHGGQWLLSAIQQVK